MTFCVNTGTTQTSSKRLALVEEVLVWYFRLKINLMIVDMQ